MGNLIHLGMIDKSIILAIISGIGRYFSEIVVSAKIYIKIISFMDILL